MDEQQIKQNQIWKLKDQSKLRPKINNEFKN